MKWSIKLGRYAGIDVYMHLTFLLLVGWVALVHWQQGQSAAAAIAGVIFILAVFLCVVLHEFGHALTARKYGIKTKDIILLPIGGVARLEKMPSKPIQELWVALAGPAVNIIIAALLFAWLFATASLQPFQTLTVTAGPFLERLLFVNLFLVAFNMVPAFPMDGGRVLRALLAIRLDYAKATRIAASIGQGVALLFAFIGLMYNPMLLLIAFFVWVGAGQEANAAQFKNSFGEIPVRQAMLTDFRTLDRGDNLGRAIELTLAGSQKDFPVVGNGAVEGILTQNDLLKAISAGEQQAPVVTAMQSGFTAVNSFETLETAYEKLQACNCQTLPVTQEGKLVGLLTMDNLGEFMRIQAAVNN